VGNDLPLLIRNSLIAALEASGVFGVVSAPGREPLRLWAVTTRGRELAMNLDSLYADARRAGPAERDRMVEQFAAALVEAGRIADAATPEGGLEQLVPLIKSASWLDAGPGRVLAYRPLVADLNVVYAFDSENVSAYATVAQLQQLHLPADQIHETAIANLRLRIPQTIQTKGDGKSFLLMVGGNFESSLILLDEVWEDLAGSISGDAIASVLARDVCLVTGSAIVGGIESLRAARERICALGLPSHFISWSLIRRVDRGWAVFRG